MRRTQIMLKEEQYHAVRGRARRDGKSMGQVIRDLVDTGLAASSEAPGQRRSLKDVKGILRAPESRGRDHDRYLYDGEK